MRIEMLSGFTANISMEMQIVLDPFMGSGTTGMVASQMGRHFVGIELNPEYTELAYKRIGGEI